MCVLQYLDSQPNVEDHEEKDDNDNGDNNADRWEQGWWQSD